MADSPTSAAEAAKDHPSERRVARTSFNWKLVAAVAVAAMTVMVVAKFLFSATPVAEKGAVNPAPENGAAANGGISREEFLAGLAALAQQRQPEPPAAAKTAEGAKTSLRETTPDGGSRPVSAAEAALMTRLAVLEERLTAKVAQSASPPPPPPPPAPLPVDDGSEVARLRKRVDALVAAQAAERPAQSQVVNVQMTASREPVWTPVPTTIQSSWVSPNPQTVASQRALRDPVSLTSLDGRTVEIVERSEAIARGAHLKGRTPMVRHQPVAGGTRQVLLDGRLVPETSLSNPVPCTEERCTQQACERGGDTTRCSGNTTVLSFLNDLIDINIYPVVGSGGRERPQRGPVWQPPRRVRSCPPPPPRQPRPCPPGQRRGR